MDDALVLNGERYVKESSVAQFQGDLKIVILQRGWVMVGIFEKNGDDCKLHKAKVIRKWGTTKGIGELAANGPLKDTVLDSCHGVVEFDKLTVVATVACNKEAWDAKQA